MSGSVANAASYQKIDLTIVDPIQDTSGGVHSYSGIDLEPFANLFGVDLTRAYLSDAHLSDANLTNANLVEAYLFFAYLSDATLSFADLTNTQLSYADLSGASLYFADLHYASLHKATLIGANLNFADLSHALVSDANLTNATLRGANLTGANLTGANLTGADLTSAVGLDLSTGSALYNVNTIFTDTGFDPVAAGWTLLPEPDPTVAMLSSMLVIAGLRRLRAASSSV